MRKILAALGIGLSLVGVSKNGLANERVVFPDPNFDACVREHLNNFVGEFHESDLTRITLLSCYERSISSIEGAEALIGLRSLSLFGNNLVEIGPLAPLRELTSLNLRDNNIPDLAPLAPLTKLRKLILSNNAFSDIEPLRGHIALKNLFLAGNHLLSLEVLREFNELTDLSLEGVGPITALDMLSGMRNLTRLWLGGNSLTSEIIAPLRDLKNMEQLYIANNNLSDISAIGGMSALIGIQLTDNLVRNVAPLTELKELRELWIDDNCVSDFSPLDGSAITLLVGRESQNGPRCGAN